MPGFKEAFQSALPPERRGRLSADDLMGPDVDRTTKNKFQLLAEWHGIPTQLVKDEFIGNCIFYDCASFIEQKPDKFTMNCKTGQWRCFVCGRNGNAPIFIREIHRNSLDQTTDQQLHKLKELRKHAIEFRDLKEMQAAFNPITKEWTLPAWNRENTMNQLYMWREEFNPTTGKKHRQFLASPTLQQLWYGLNRVSRSSNRPIYVWEGHWDYLAAMGLMRRLEKEHNVDIIAVPGAGTHPSASFDIFNGREILLMMDNDLAGENGADSFIKVILKAGIIPKLIRKIEWPSSLKAGFDLSDCITSLPEKLRKKDK